MADVKGGVIRDRNSLNEEYLIFLETGIKVIVLISENKMTLIRDSITDGDIKRAKEWISTDGIKKLEQKKLVDEKEIYDKYSMMEKKIEDIVGIENIIQVIHNYYYPTCTKITYSYSQVGDKYVERHTVEYEK